MNLLNRIAIHTKNGMICAVTFDGKRESILDGLQKEAYLQLQQYFDGTRKEFDLPLKLEGTDFQIKVWRELMKIPYGQVVTYSDIAQRIGQPKACRAVGNANGKNRIPIIIPCHRVIASGGKLGGYSGGLDIKLSLLEVEGIRI